MELIANLEQWKRRYSKWRFDENLAGYSFVENIDSPFNPVRRALPMLNLALISTAGSFITGTTAFETDLPEGDLSFREIPVEVEASDLSFAARGYDPTDVRRDRNAQVPVDRLLEYQENGVIGKLNPVWWSLNGFIPNAAGVAVELAPKLVERIQRHEVQAALIIPASKLCHQTAGILARAIEISGIPTMMIAVERAIVDRVRPPRVAFYDGEYGCVAGKPNWKQYQHRVLDESLRWIETFDQPTVKKLTVDLETQVETARGER